VTDPVVFGITAGGDVIHRTTLSAGDLTVALLSRGALVKDLRITVIYN